MLRHLSLVRQIDMLNRWQLSGELDSNILTRSEFRSVYPISNTELERAVERFTYPGADVSVLPRLCLVLRLSMWLCYDEKCIVECCCYFDTLSIMTIADYCATFQEVAMTIYQSDRNSMNDYVANRLLSDGIIATAFVKCVLQRNRDYDKTQLISTYFDLAMKLKYDEVLRPTLCEFEEGTTSSPLRSAIECADTRFIDPLRTIAGDVEDAEIIYMIPSVDDELTTRRFDIALRITPFIDASTIDEVIENEELPDAFKFHLVFALCRNQHDRREEWIHVVRDYLSVVDESV